MRSSACLKIMSSEHIGCPTDGVIGISGQGERQKSSLSLHPQQPCRRRAAPAYGQREPGKRQTGRALRDALLGLMQGCTKLGLSFWDYIGHRLGIAGPAVPDLADLVRQRAAAA